MARRRLRLAWIPNEAARRATMRKRRQSLVKKVKELSVLCGVPAFIVVYCPDEPEPTVWPPEREEAEKLLARFLAAPPFEQTKRTTNQETYLVDQVGKLQEARGNQEKVLNQLELAYLMDQVFSEINVHYTRRGLGGLDLHGLNRLSVLLEERLIEIRKKAEFFEVELNGSSSLGRNNVTNVNNDNVVVPENINDLLWQEDFMNNIINQDGGGDDGNGN
ncbi:unnamed protein product [Linum tenue]|uniref:MADS-box domain-containing protein n=1 Tax=Linum tenue TaxID=586396 RepID=A0AAV0N2U4_9ROSI|nr:unnamed protein product [Linum tenue]